MKLKLMPLVLLLMVGAQTFASTDATLEAKMDAWVQKIHNNGRFDGAVLVARNGETIFEKGYGMANQAFQVPNDPDTVFLVGSVSKQFASMLVLQLAADGKLDLQDPVTKFFPEFDAKKWSGVTVHHLLSHGSGLGHYRHLARTLSEMGDSFETFDRVHRPVAEYARIIGKMSLNTAPGESFAYSSMGYILLGVIVERVSGNSFHDQMQERICKPLGMTHTGFAYAAEIVPRLAPGYVPTYLPDDKGEPISGLTNETYRDQSNKYCTGGVHSTVRDMAKWARGLWTEKLLPAAYRDKMFSKQLGIYGYGWRVFEGEDLKDSFTQKIVGHGGSLMGYKAHIQMADGGTYAVIALSNNGYGLVRAVTSGIFDIIDGEEPKHVFNGVRELVPMLGNKEKAMALVPKLQKGGYHLGQNTFNNTAYELMGGGFADRAATLLDIAISLHPDEVNLYDSRAEAYARGGHKDKAIAAYRDSLERAKKAGIQSLVTGAEAALERLTQK